MVLYRLNHYIPSINLYHMQTSVEGRGIIWQDNAAAFLKVKTQII